METSLWNQCLRRLEAELTEQSFNTWIRPLQAVEDGGRLRLLAPNRYVVDWVNQNCASRIGELLEELVPPPAPTVVLEVGSRRAVPTAVPVAEGISPPPPPATKPTTAVDPRTKRDAPVLQFGGRLNPDFTFSNFVEGKSNQLARAAAVQVAENPGRAYNPLPLYGGTGLDKNGRPRMDLMSFASKKNPAGAAPEKVRNLATEKFTKRAFKVRWEDPAEVKPGMRFVYRLKTPGRAWKGWLQAGTSHAIVVGTPQKGVYKVQVAAKWGKERGDGRALTYRNR